MSLRPARNLASLTARYHGLTPRQGDPAARVPVEIRKATPRWGEHLCHLRSRVVNTCIELDLSTSFKLSKYPNGIVGLADRRARSKEYTHGEEQSSNESSGRASSVT